MRVLFVFWSLLLVSAATSQSMEKQIMDAMFTNYDKYERPGMSSGETTNVMIYFKILVLNLNTVSNEMTVDMYFRQKWKDPRLAWKKMAKFSSYLNDIDMPQATERIWLPDIFFRNGKSGYTHSMMFPNRLLRVSNDGTILYSQKLTMTFSCPHDYGRFPMDYVTCVIDIGSYSYRSSQLKLYWREDMSAVTIDRNAVSGREFRPLDKVEIIDCTQKYATSTGSYSCLNARFNFGQRNIAPYRYRLYVPTALAVIVGWLALWLDSEATTARICMAGLPFLFVVNSLVNAFFAMGVTALHVWLMFCACLLFLELVLITVLKFIENNLVGKGSEEGRGSRSRLLFLLELILGRILLLALFLLFNIIYWSLFR